MKHYHFKITHEGEVRYMETWARNEEVARKHIREDYINLKYLNENADVKVELINF